MTRRRLFWRPRRAALLLVGLVANCGRWEATADDAAPGGSVAGSPAATEAGAGGAGQAGAAGAADDGGGGVSAAGTGGMPDAGAGGEPEGGYGGAPSAGGGGELPEGTAGAPEPAAPPDGPGVVFERVTLPGVSQATDFGFIPGKKNELLVLSHAGGVSHLRLEGDTAEIIGETSLDEVYRKEGCGLLSLAFDPDFEKNHYVYLGYCTSRSQSVLSRHVFDSISTIADTTTEILSVETEEEPDEYWHRWGSLGFEPDGETMWAFLGDHFFKANGQDKSEKFGSLLRFVPSRKDDEGGMVPAKGNAFEDEDDGDPSVFAYGFRSPWRGTLDSRGRFWVGDVGLVTFEEVDLVTEAGQNFGWSKKEGPCSSNCDGLVDPVTAWGRDGDDDYTAEDEDTEPEVRRAVWVGEVYDAPSTDRYFDFHDDLVIFGDFYTGWVRGLRVDGAGKITDDLLLGHLPQVTSWRVGPDGYMYALTYPGRLERALPRPGR